MSSTKSENKRSAPENDATTEPTSEEEVQAGLELKSIAHRVRVRFERMHESQGMEEQLVTALVSVMVLGE